MYISHHWHMEKVREREKWETIHSRIRDPGAFFDYLNITHIHGGKIEQNTPNKKKKNFTRIAENGCKTFKNTII
jgi:hypothetical protein